MNLLEDWLRPFYLATITCCFLNMFIIELNGQGLAMSGNQKLPGGKRNNRDAPNTPGSFGGQLGTYVSVKNHQVTFQKRLSFMAWRKLESYEIPSGYVKIAIENGHRHGWFSIVMWLFTRPGSPYFTSDTYRVVKNTCFTRRYQGTGFGWFFWGTIPAAP